jgi:hypothetical protein
MQPAFDTYIKINTVWDIFESLVRQSL